MYAQGYPHFSAQEVAQLGIFLKCGSCVCGDVCFICLKVFVDGRMGVKLLSKIESV